VDGRFHRTLGRRDAGRRDYELTDHESFRVAPDKIHYRFTVEDSQAFTQPFTGEMPFYRTDDAIYEYACHEGNYALRGILGGAREQEKASR
jgi:hypothetical protein